MVQIAIIGGGIGGLTAALALRQSGFEAEVFEQAPELLEVGAAIAIWSNAMRVLERLNLADEILKHAGVVEELCWLDPKGVVINRVSIKGNTPAVALHRADLQNTLLHALPSAAIHLNHKLVDYKQRDEKMVATFANGNSIEADFLVGADGIHSRVRSQFLNDGDPVDRGYAVWRGTSAITLAALSPTAGFELHGRGQRFGIGPVGTGRTGWWASANSSSDDLLRLFAGWWAPVRELIEATPPSSILKTRVSDRPASRSWGAGRLTLLGDAIHPTTPNLGQGGCLAMEDALVLARCFEKYGAGEEALRRYERCRHQRTTAITRYSRYYGAVGQWENVFARALRRTGLALIPESVARALMNIVFDYDPTEASL